MTEPTPLVDPINNTEAHVIDAAVHQGRVSLFRRLLKSPVGLIAMVVLALVALSAIFAPLLAPARPELRLDRRRPRPARSGPSARL